MYFCQYAALLTTLQKQISKLQNPFPLPARLSNFSLFMQTQKHQWLYTEVFKLHLEVRNPKSLRAPSLCEIKSPFHNLCSQQ